VNEARIRERKFASRVLVGRPERRKLPGRLPRGWKNNIEIDVSIDNTGGRGLSLCQDRNKWHDFVKAVTKRHVPWNAGNFLAI